MNKCNICNRQFKDDFYDKEQGKCILHCEKDSWYDILNNEKDWTKSEDKIKLFWQQIRAIIENRFEDEDYQRGASLDFSKTIFPKFEKQYEEVEEYEEGYYNITDWYDNFCSPNITSSQSLSHDLEVGLNFSNSIFLDDVDLNYYNFMKYVSFNNVQFKGKCSFLSTIFKEVTFNNVIFFQSVHFEKAKINFFSYRSGDFENTIFHNEAKFYECTFGTEDSKKDFDIDFKGTQFQKVHISSCTFHNGLRFSKDVKVKYIDIQNLNLKELYIASDTQDIHIRGNKKKISKLTIKHQNLKNLMIHNCVVGSDFLLNDKVWKKDEVFKIDQLDFSESTFKGKVKIQFYEITGTTNFYNTKFKDLADFYQTKFNKVIFERTDFEKIAVFSEAEFHQDVDFKYTKFLGKSIFRDTVIEGELDLRNTIFDDEANFLDITSQKRKKSYKDEYIGDAKEIKVSNRETARIIKNFYDASNNIIEANKFYALEMEKREYELKEAVAEGHFRFFLESSIFKIHGITSNHSQDWFLSLLWILNITFMYSIYSSTNNYHNNMLATIFFYSVVLSLFIYQNPRFLLKIILIMSALMFLLLSYITLDTVADKINPFSIMKSKEPITFGLLIFKITIAYLIYQFIVSVRQNTRRK